MAKILKKINNIKCNNKCLKINSTGKPIYHFDDFYFPVNCWRSSVNGLYNYSIADSWIKNISEMRISIYMEDGINLINLISLINLINKFIPNHNIIIDIFDSSDYELAKEEDEIEKLKEYSRRITMSLNITVSNSITSFIEYLKSQGFKEVNYI